MQPGDRCRSMAGWTGTVEKVVQTSSLPYAVVRWDRTGETGRHTVTTLQKLEGEHDT